MPTHLFAAQGAFPKFFHKWVEFVTWALPPFGVLLLILLAWWTPPLMAQPGDIALLGGRLIDGNGGTPVESSVIVICGERIVAVGDSSVKPPADARVIDVAGKTIMPGLISAHSHLGLVKGESVAPEENFTRENVAAQLAQFERYGVTAVLSLGTNQDALYSWREEQRAGMFPGADIFTADRGIGVPSSGPPLEKANPIYRPKTPDEARGAVRESAARHPDLLKIWVDDFLGSVPKMAPEIYRTVIDEAHRNHLRVASHLFYLADAKALVANGIDLIAHSVRDQMVDAEFIGILKEKGIPYLSTLSLDESQYIYAEHPVWMDEPFFTQAVEPALLAKWRTTEYCEKIRRDPKTPRNKAAAAVGQQNTRLLYDGGAFLAMGTDSGATPTRVIGFAEHRELQLLVQAGLEPMAAIVISTRNSARAIGDERNRGTLEAGKRADFLVLSANPLDKIANTELIEAVWHGGRPIPLHQKEN